MKFGTALVAIIAQMTAITEASHQLEFAFLFSRHGARVFHFDADMSLFEDDLAQFNKGVEMLTPQGMRQRYLKGRYNRARFADLLSDEYVPGEVFV